MRICRHLLQVAGILIAQFALSTVAREIDTGSQASERVHPKSVLSMLATVKALSLRFQPSSFTVTLSTLRIQATVIVSGIHGLCLLS